MKMPQARAWEPPSADVCEPAQSGCTWTSHKSNFMGEFKGKKLGPKIGTHASCDPAQSKCTWTDVSQEQFYARIYRKMPGPKINRAWTSHKLNCMREFSRKKTGPKVETTPRPTLCASCAVKMHMDMDICEEAVHAKVFKENAPDQDRDNRFRQACAVKMHMDMDICEEAVYAKVFKENAPDQDRDNHFMRACAVEMHMAICEEAVYARMFNENAPDQDRDNRFVRVCAVDMQMDISQDQFYARIYGKKVGKSNPSPNSYRKNPSVWTQKCFKLRRILSSNSFSVPWVPWVRRVPGSSYARLSRPASRPPVLTSPSSWPQLSLLRKAKASRKPHTFRLSRERERER